MADLRAAPCVVVGLLCALAVVARADDELSVRERRYGALLAERAGDDGAQVERVTRPGATGVRMSLPGVTTERLRFASPADAEAFARSLPVGEAGLVEVRGAQVFVARGPRLAEAELADRLRASGWEVLPAPASAPSVVRDLGDARPRRGRVSPGTTPISQPTVARPVAPINDNYGATELLAHHLNGEALRQLVPGSPAVDLAGTRANVAAAVAAADPELMGAHQRGRVLPAYDALSPTDRAAFDALLAEHAGEPAVRDQLLRALAAGSPVDDVRWLAGELRGRDPAWIAEHTRLTAPHGVSALQQQFNDSCAPTTVQALRGEYDPVYALRLRQGNRDVTMIEERGNGMVAGEQRRILEANGGVAVPMGTEGGEGLDDPDWINALNRMAPRSGLTFTQEGGFSTPLAPERTIAILDEHLSQGRVVPLGLSAAPTGDKGGGGGGHAVLATNVRRDAAGEPSFLIFDPGEGVSVWVSARQIREGGVRIAGWDLIDTAMIPTPT